MHVTCPACKAALTAPDEAAGKTLTCPQCRQSMPIPATAASFDAPQLPVEPSATELLRSIRLAVWINAWFLIAGLVLAILWGLISASAHPGRGY